MHYIKLYSNTGTFSTTNIASDCITTDFLLTKDMIYLGCYCRQPTVILSDSSTKWTVLKEIKEEKQRKHLTTRITAKKSGINSTAQEKKRFFFMYTEPTEPVVWLEMTRALGLGSSC